MPAARIRSTREVVAFALRWAHGLEQLLLTGEDISTERSIAAYEHYLED